MTIVGDFAAAGINVMIFGVIVYLARGLQAYLVIPITLIIVHLIGDVLRYNDIGAQWIQDHLHNVGIAAYALIVCTWCSRRKPRGVSLAYAISDGFTKATPWVHGAATLTCISYEIVEVTVFRDDMLAANYSGNLDISDILAYVVGFIVIMANHIVMRPRVMRRVAKYEVARRVS